MTFLSPVFICIFLPIALSVYAIAPKFRRVELLPIISTVFFVCINIHDIFSLIYYVVFAALVVIALRLYKKTRKFIWLEALRGISVFLIVILGGLSFFSGREPLYFVGALLVLMSTISLCTDVIRGYGRTPDTPWDGLIYVTFFPTSIVGPFVKYGDFVEKLDAVDFSLANFNRGASRFLVGFIKCAVVSSLLGRAYDLIIVADPHIGFLVFLIAAALISLKVYSFLSGYSDMARGIALMLGIEIESDFPGSLLNSTPTSYVRRFGRSFSNFIKAYVAEPIDVLFLRKRTGRIIGSLLTGAAYVFLICPTVSSAAVLYIPIVVVSYFIMYRGSENKRMKIKKAIKPFLGIFTFFLMSVAWVVAKSHTISSIEAIFSEIVHTDVFYAPYSVISIITNPKYILIPVVIYIVVTLMSRFICERESDPEGDYTIARLTAKSIASIVVFALFILSVVYMLPQFPEFSSFAKGFVFV